MSKIEWHTEQRKLSELRDYEHNPRQMTEKQDKDLRKSLTKFSLAEIPAINTDGTLIAGHQRCRILKDMHGDMVIDVRVPNRKLNEKELQEYNIRSNKNVGEWDFDVLANAFEKDELIEWGFKEHEIGIPDFEPVGEDEQGKLDEKAPKIVQCPECGHSFDAND